MKHFCQIETDKRFFKPNYRALPTTIQNNDADKHLHEWIMMQTFAAYAQT